MIDIKNNTSIKSHWYSNPFCTFCFATLCFCLLVILWGAWVRISHSGDGCGQSWPSCHGQYLMDSGEQAKTWIEWIHRVSSGLFGIMVFILTVWTFLKFPFRQMICKSVLFVLFFTISEALIGARLVLAGLTGSDTSLARVLTMNLHLLNSLLLTSSIFICWRLSLGRHFSLSVKDNLSLFSGRKHLIIFILIFFLLAFFGSLSSLSASLFPSSSLWQGLSMDFDSDSPWLIRWRLLHPVLALICGGGFLYYILQKSLLKNSNFLPFSGSGKIFTFCLCLILFSGLMNLLLLSPVFLKLAHLLIVYLFSMSFILTLETKPSQ